MVKKLYQFENTEQQLGIIGPQDSNLHLLAEGLKVSLTTVGNQLQIVGEDENASATWAVIEQLTHLIKKGIKLAPADFMSAVTMAQRGTLEYFNDLYTETLLRDQKGRAIRVKSFGQRQYVQAIRNNDITFGIGPAGTGKTFLAVVMAVAALKRGDVERIIITRPAIEAGESLGFLPGDLKEKVDPYLRPIYDALYAVLGKEHTERLLERETIEIAPLAYMRGRTLDSAFIILDEAQNTTPQQMKMFLTRFGFGSKMIVNGDISQIDLAKNQQSGLIQIEKVLSGVKRIEFIHFATNDVVRHPVVGAIVQAYEHYDERVEAERKDQ
ncbi:PhoH family protein [Weissella kandleri]|uniref:PhoH family protein n=1 Tax=Weissella kandleri TaxID=1616 RepID=UPI00387E4170